MIGYCRYCQQGMHVADTEVTNLLLEIGEQCEDFEITEEIQRNAANHIATAECKCDGATYERLVKEYEENAIANINQIFGEKDEYMIQYLREGATLICRGNVKRITIDTGKGIKAVMAMGKDGVKIRREKKITEEAV